MLRKFLSAAIVWGLFACLAPAEEKKPPVELKRPEGFSPPVMGIIKKIDAEKGTLTVTVKKGETEKDVVYKITDDTKFMVAGGFGEKPKIVTGKDGLKAKQFKVGAAVHVMAGKDNTAKMVGSALGIKPPFGGPTPKFKTGKIKSMDAEKGVLVITVDDKPVTINVTEKTMFMAFENQRPKMLKGKEGLKSDAFKVGEEVRFFQGPQGMTMIMPTKLLGYKPPFERGEGGLSTIKQFDAKKGILTVTTKGKEEELKLSDETKFMVMGKKYAKPLTAEDAAKNKAFKVGAQVRLMRDNKGNVRMVMAMPDLKGIKKEIEKPEKEEKPKEEKKAKKDEEEKKKKEKE
jgi:hypothetical protein